MLTVKDCLWVVVALAAVQCVAASGLFDALSNCRWLDASNAPLVKSGEYNPYRDFNMFVNNLLLPKAIVDYVTNAIENETLRYYALSYCRDFIMGTIVYWVTAGTWHIVIYDILGDRIFTKNGREFPKWSAMFDAISLAQSSVVLYAALPVLSEFLIESGITKVYFYIDEVGGWGPYFGFLFVYIVLVEIGIYWVHRTLHTNKFLYKYLHALHHKYNKATTMSPWVSIAFNPIDGLFQASPYVIFMFIVPVHFFTHVFLLFFSGVWATNIHDAVPTDWEPIMGAKYHLIHHTHYHYNFGQWFTFCDAFWGSLRSPEEIAELEKGRQKKSTGTETEATTVVSPKKSKARKAD